MAEQSYNPLDKVHLGESVVRALLERPVVVLPPSESFVGAGLYALYYAGDFAAYRPIAEQNRPNAWTMPIYVGKAVPAGARKGGYGLGMPAGDVLYRRLCEHASSIQQTTNLALSDFRCRYLVVDDIWIPLGESLLIAMFVPLWNHHLDGFGNHDPGSGRYNQRRSAWDEMHPGRPWAAKLRPHLRSQVDIVQSLLALTDTIVEEIVVPQTDTPIPDGTHVDIILAPADMPPELQTELAQWESEQRLTSQAWEPDPGKAPVTLQDVCLGSTHSTDVLIG